MFLAIDILPIISKNCWLRKVSSENLLKQLPLPIPAFVNKA